MHKPFFDMTFTNIYIYIKILKQFELRVRIPLSMFGKPNSKAESIV